MVGLTVAASIGEGVERRNPGVVVAVAAGKTVWNAGGAHEASRGISKNKNMKARISIDLTFCYLIRIRRVVISLIL
jgi:hypothetical protein